MNLGRYKITSIENIKKDVIKIRFISPSIATSAKPGQFINIKIENSTIPLLRRPFSIHFVEDEEVEIIFGIFGKGTYKLAENKIGATLDILGPLGKPFNTDKEEDISILIGGGIGVAPFPLLSETLLNQNKNIVTLLGAKNKNYLIKNRLINLKTATDDGSEGYHGSVVKLFEEEYLKNNIKNIKAYVCGPSPMLIAMNKLKEKYIFKCEVSLETSMACGIGICQGCAVQSNVDFNKYFLSCVDGPVFNIDDVSL